MIARRPVLAGMAALLGGLPTMGRAAVPKSGRIAFELIRKGDRIGSHTLNFSTEGEEVVVAIAIDIKITVALIPVFRYGHRNRERWRNDRLISIEAETNDDGDKLFVRGIASDGAFRVESTSGSRVLPAEVVPTSYWNPRTLEASQLLNTQDGSVSKVTVKPVGIEPVSTVVGPVEAKGYEMAGDLNLRFWYDLEQVLARIRFNAKSDGSTIDYRRI